ncbi:MAG TPA: hypothetical protein VG963_02380 [Polyangiaceae bacterium]|nr:hypothetical protein [Polyangiaceae bacterium]
MAANVWELELAQVAAESGSPDLQAIADALGMHATLRGGYRDPAHPKEPTRALLSAPSEGIGLNVMLETPP